MFKKVAFTMFAAEDSTRARAFYEEKLGLKRGSSSSEGTHGGRESRSSRSESRTAAGY